MNQYIWNWMWNEVNKAETAVDRQSLCNSLRENQTWSTWKPDIFGFIKFKDLVNRDFFNGLVIWFCDNVTDRRLSINKHCGPWRTCIVLFCFYFIFVNSIPQNVGMAIHRYLFWPWRSTERETNCCLNRLILTLNIHRVLYNVLYLSWRHDMITTSALLVFPWVTYRWPVDSPHN